MKNIAILVAGRNQGLTYVDWCPGMPLTKQILPIDFGAKSTFGLARCGNSEFNILVAPNHFHSDDLCYLGMGYTPQLLTDIPKPGPKGIHRDLFDWHGATYTNLGFFITSTRFGLAWFEYSIETGFPVFKGWFQFDYDPLWHVNAVLVHDGFCYLCFHRLSEKMKVPSRVVCFGANFVKMTLTKLDEWEVGRDIHDLVYVPDHGIITCSSAEARVVGVDWNYELIIEPSEAVENPYVRGLYYSIDSDVLVIGKSGKSKEEERIGNCELDFYDFESSTLIDRVELPNAGTIHQIIDYGIAESGGDR